MRPALCVLAWGCTSPLSSSSTELGQVRLVLEHGWSKQPWAAHSAPRSERITLTSTVNLPATLPREGAVLELSGAWRRVEVTVNQTELGPVDGGLAVAEIPVGPHLSAGENTLTVRISPPQDPRSIAAGGTLSSVGYPAGRAQLLAPPVLVMRPSVHIRDLLVSPVGDGVVARAHVPGTTHSGDQVAFTALLPDGRSVSLGSASVEAGWAIAPKMEWTAPRWSPLEQGRDALFSLQATLRTASGEPLDQVTRRTAVRSLEADGRGLRLNGNDLQLVGLRTVPSSKRPTLAHHLYDLHTSGLNAIELHGDVALDSWLDDADELGLPVVVVPRCAGRTDDGNVAGLDGELNALLRRLTRHPSVVLLASDPAGGILPALSSAAQASNWPRAPMAGVELDALVLKVPLADAPARCFPENCRGWIVESTPAWKRLERKQREQLTEAERWQSMSTAWTSAREMQAIGGIFPQLESGRDPALHPVWSSAARAAADAFQITPLDRHRRGPSRVMVSGATPGAVVVARTPDGRTAGALANHIGTAELSLWGTGAVSIYSGEQRAKTTLTASAWVDLKEQPAPVSVTLTPAP